MTSIDLLKKNDRLKKFLQKAEGTFLYKSR